MVCSCCCLPVDISAVLALGGAPRQCLSRVVFMCFHCLSTRECPESAFAINPQLLCSEALKALGIQTSLGTVMGPSLSFKKKFYNHLFIRFPVAGELIAAIDIGQVLIAIPWPLDRTRLKHEVSRQPRSTGSGACWD